MDGLPSIRAGESICTLAPELGGSIVSWQVNGQDMLRRTSNAALTDGGRLGLASFPLVPYSNRIGQGTFKYSKRRFDLTRNFPPEPHALHGTGWEDLWATELRRPDQIILNLLHPGDARWPWAFAAEQIITILADGLKLELCAQNLSDEAAPLAFGHHPYFDQAGAMMQFEAQHVWMSGDDNLPKHVVPPSGQYLFETRGPVAGRSVDNCYADWSGRTRIDWTGRPLALEIISSMRAAVVYIPEGGDAFCFEPVPHINNALNLAAHEPAMPVIAAGESYRSSIEYNVVTSS